MSGPGITLIDCLLNSEFDHSMPGQTSVSLNASLPHVRLYNAALHAITEAECISLVFGALAVAQGGSIITMNLDHLWRFVHEPTYAASCRRASLVIADGMPLVWASRLQGTPLPERVTGSNLIWSLSASAAHYGRSVFLLGGRPGTAQATAERLVERYPRLRVVGTLCPPLGFEEDGEELTRLTNALVSTQPDIVYVALGSPKQERLIERLRDCLPSAWWVGVGITFSFVAGEISRAPLWMQRAGLEWLHRLAQEPRRLTHRYLVRGMPFALALFSHALSQRLSRPS